MLTAGKPCGLVFCRLLRIIRKPSHKNALKFAIIDYIYQPALASSIHIKPGTRNPAVKVKRFWPFSDGGFDKHLFGEIARAGVAQQWHGRESSTKIEVIYVGDSVHNLHAVT